MWAWWDSLQKVTTANNVLLFAAASSGLLTAVLGLAVWKVGARMALLQDKENMEFRSKSAENIALANARAAEANSSAAGANSLAQGAIARTEESRLQQERLRSENLKLQSRVEEERTARLKIEERLAPRRLTESQRTKLLFGLSKLKGKQLVLRPIMTDAETEAFALELQGVFETAGLIVKYESSIMAQTPVGLVLFAGKHRDKDARELVTALAGAGLVEMPIPGAQPNGDDELGLAIGRK